MIVRIRLRLDRLAGSLMLCLVHASARQKRYEKVDQTRKTQAEKEEVSGLARAGLYYTNPLACDIQAAAAAEALGERVVRERIRE